MNQRGLDPCRRRQCPGPLREPLADHAQRAGRGLFPGQEERIVRSNILRSSPRKRGPRLGDVCMLGPGSPLSRGRTERLRSRRLPNTIRVASRPLDPTSCSMETDQLVINHCVFDTAIGTCGVPWSGRGLIAGEWPGRDRAATERRLTARTRGSAAATPPPAIATLIADITRYLAGEQVDFSAVPVDLSGLDPFRRKLYETMRALPWGTTTTYGALARTIGLANWEGARDVGEAMGRNPVPIVIPCHRVLAAGNKLGGFSAPGGAATKAKLLALEGVRFDGGASRLPGL